MMLICLLMIWIAGTFGPLKPYIQVVKQGNNTAEALQIEQTANGDLLSWLRQEAVSQTIPAIDAVNDRIWKAIPGYEGREVDIQATYRKFVESGFDRTTQSHNIPWVYKVIKPKVELNDLPPLPVFRGNPSKPMVAFMINVAWGDEHLQPMLDTLEKANVHATFFFDGKWLSSHTEMAKEIIARGHEASNHAYSHPDMSKLGEARQREEIDKTEQLLKKLGVTNRWFAPPSGDYSQLTVKIAAEQGLRTVLWTLDTIDWKNPPSWSVVAKVKAKVGAGTLILMHPTAASAGALDGMIKAIKSKGYELGTVSETLSSTRL